MSLALPLDAIAEPLSEVDLNVVSEPEPMPPEPIKEPLKELPEPSFAALSNCYLFIKEVYYPDLPSTKVIRAGIKPGYGDIAVFYYPNSGQWHFAKTTGVTFESFTIDETNYKKGTRTVREIKFTDPRLKGFYNMPGGVE